MMIPCQVSTLSGFICSDFQFEGHLAKNKSLNALKIANEVRKGSNFSMWLLMVHIECTKSSEFKKVHKNEMPLEKMSFRLKPKHFEIDGPVCTRSASTFCLNPLNLCTHVMWVK